MASVTSPLPLHHTAIPHHATPRYQDTSPRLTPHSVASHPHVHRSTSHSGRGPSNMQTIARHNVPHPHPQPHPHPHAAPHVVPPLYTRILFDAASETREHLQTGTHPGAEASVRPHPLARGHVHRSRAGMTMPDASGATTPPPHVHVCNPSYSSPDYLGFPSPEQPHSMGVSSGGRGTGSRIQAQGVVRPVSNYSIPPLFFKLARKQHVDLRCVLLSDPRTARCRVYQPKHVSNPGYRNLNHIYFNFNFIVCRFTRGTALWPRAGPRQVRKSGGNCGRVS